MKIFENGPYFYNSVGLFLTPWKERFDPDKENLMIVLVWIRMYSLEWNTGRNKYGWTLGTLWVTLSKSQSKLGKENIYHILEYVSTLTYPEIFLMG